MQGLPAPLPPLPSCLQELTGSFAGQTSKSLEMQQTDSSSQLLGQYFHPTAAFPSGECSSELLPEVQWVEECSSLKSVRSIALLFILQAFLCR